MTERDWRTYCDLYETMITMLQPPQIVVYLQASVPRLRRHIEQRGRDFEQQISDHYLEQLNGLYEKWISSFTQSPVLTINTDNLDYVQYEDHLDMIWEKIEQRLHGRDYLQL